MSETGEDGNVKHVWFDRNFPPTPEVQLPSRILESLKLSRPEILRITEEAFWGSIDEFAPEGSQLRAHFDRVMEGVETGFTIRDSGSTNVEMVAYQVDIDNILSLRKESAKKPSDTLLSSVDVYIGLGDIEEKREDLWSCSHWDDTVTEAALRWASYMAGAEVLYSVAIGEENFDDALYMDMKNRGITMLADGIKNEFSVKWTTTSNRRKFELGMEVFRFSHALHMLNSFLDSEKSALRCSESDRGQSKIVDISDEIVTLNNRRVIERAKMDQEVYLGDLINAFPCDVAELRGLISNCYN